MIRESLLDGDLDDKLDQEISDTYYVSQVNDLYFTHIMTKTAIFAKANPILDKKCNKIESNLSSHHERYMKYRCIIYDILKLPAIVAFDNITFGKYVKEIVQKYVKKPSASKIKVRVSKTIGDKDSIYIFISEDKTREFKETVKMNNSKFQDMGMTMIGECNIGINLKKK
jgi:hypothetical protein